MIACLFLSGFLFSCAGGALGQHPTAPCSTGARLRPKASGASTDHADKALLVTLRAAWIQQTCSQT